MTNVTEERHYDSDADGLIEITTLAQLDAVRHDTNGDGIPTAGGSSAYRAAFPDAFPEADSQLRCVLECLGYELMADLDFDTDDDGDVDSDDDYWNNGAGWHPIGRSGRSDFLTTFEGNGHTVRNLLIDRPSTNLCRVVRIYRLEGRHPKRRADPGRRGRKNVRRRPGREQSGHHHGMLRHRPKCQALTSEYRRLGWE